MAREGRDRSGRAEGERRPPLSPELLRSVRACVVASRFNREVTRRLETGARDALERDGVPADRVDVIRVPGAWELPFAVSRAGARYDLVVAVGCVVRGETPHFDYICRAATDGLLRCQLDGIPVGFGLLTTETLDQGLARAGGEQGNKGAEAAEAALEMLGLKRSLGGSGPESGPEPGPSTSATAGGRGAG